MWTDQRFFHVVCNFLEIVFPIVVTIVRNNKVKTILKILKHFLKYLNLKILSTYFFLKIKLTLIDFNIFQRFFFLNLSV